MGGERLQEVVAHGGSIEVAFPFDISSPNKFLTGMVPFLRAVVQTLEPCKVLHNVQGFELFRGF